MYIQQIEPEREEVLRALGVARLHAERLRRLDRDRRHRDLVHAEARERAVAQRVRRVARLVEVALLERVDVDEQRRAGRDVAQVRLQRGRVHRDEHVRRVARRHDVVIGDVHLERRDAGDRARRARGSRPGSSGRVARSLPNTAESSVKRSPTSCMPSPESPANRITTRSSVSARGSGSPLRSPLTSAFSSVACLGVGCSSCYRLPATVRSRTRERRYSRRAVCARSGTIGIRRVTPAARRARRSRGAAACTRRRARGRTTCAASISTRDAVAAPGAEEAPAHPADHDDLVADVELGDRRRRIPRRRPAPRSRLPRRRGS